VNDKITKCDQGDASEQYSEIRVMDICQNKKINSFSLITGRGKEFFIKKTLKWLN
jgi:hypothetical protein